MRDAAPAPMLSTWATRSLIASTSRKSSVSAPGIGKSCQLRPPSTVRSTVPFPPLAQATSGDTALTPRKRLVTPLDCECHSTAGGWATAPRPARVVKACRAMALNASRVRPLDRRVSP